MGEHTIIYQPQIIRETAEGLNRLDIRDEMLGRRELELMTPVDAESRAIAACRSSAFSSSRHPIPTLRRRKPWRQALRTASSRGSSAARSVSPPSTGANASRRKRETHD